jgi:hypothetical protein
MECVGVQIIDSGVSSLASRVFTRDISYLVEDILHRMEDVWDSTLDIFASASAYQTCSDSR